MKIVKGEVLLVLNSLKLVLNFKFQTFSPACHEPVLNWFLVFHMLLPWHHCPPSWIDRNHWSWFCCQVQDCKQVKIKYFIYQFQDWLVLKIYNIYFWSWFAFMNYVKPIRNKKLFAQNSNFLVSISLQTVFCKFILFNLTEYTVKNTKSFRHWVAKIWGFKIRVLKIWRKIYNFIKFIATQILGIMCVFS